MRRSAIFAHHWRALLAIGLLFGARRAGADARTMEPLIHVEPHDTCPTAAEIAQATWQLIPNERRAVVDSLVQVNVEHHETLFRVVVETKERTAARTFEHAESDCGKRARYAAVFIALMLMPSDAIETRDDASAKLGRRSEGETAPAPPPAAPTSPPSAPLALSPGAPSTRARPTSEPTLGPTAPAHASANRGLRLELAVGWNDGLPLARAPHIVAWAGRLACVLGGGAIAPAVAVTYQPARAFDLQGFGATVARATGTLGVRTRLSVEPLEIGFQVGALAERDQVAGTSAAVPARDSTWQLGVVGGASVAWPRGGALQPLVALDVQWLPVPHDLLMVPRGVIGRLPQMWIGASAGLALTL